MRYDQVRVWADDKTKRPGLQVNYCFVTFDNWRSAQRACNQSERNILGQVRAHCPAAASIAQHTTF